MNKLHQHDRADTARPIRSHWGLVWVLTTICAACYVLSLPQTVVAQNKSLALKAPRDVTFQTKDRVNLVGTYWESSAGEESPVVVLLHDEGDNRRRWGGKDGIAANLQKAGYAVISVDLRGHGDSAADAAQNQPKSRTRKGRKGPKLKPRDYTNMVLFDMEAVKDFLYDEHQARRLNMNKTGIVGPGMGAAVAVNFAANDWLKKPHPDGPVGEQTPRGQDVRALFLLSPKKVVGLPYPAPLGTLSTPDFKVAFFVGTGASDKRIVKDAKRIYDIYNKFGRHKDRAFRMEFPGALQGAELFSRKELKAGEVTENFFKEFLMTLPPSWRNRQSKLAGE